MANEIKNLYNSQANVRSDWKQDWKEDAKQDWKLDFTSDAWIVGTATKTGTGNGTASVVQPGRSTVAETWTLTATNATNFTVVGSVSGSKGALTVGTAYDNGFIALKITAGGTAFVAGDTFTIAITAASPANTVAPAITGNLAVGQVLTCSTGTWTGSGITYTYQWFRGNSLIKDATSSTYTLVAADSGKTMKCAVIATNTKGEDKATSNITAAVDVPVNTAVPVVSGTATVGQTLTTTNGTWTNTPTSYTYKWLRNGVAITGATASTYVLVSADSGKTVKSDVIAVNAVGSSADALSAGTAVA